MVETKGVTVFNTPNTALKFTKKNYGEWAIHMGILI